VEVITRGSLTGTFAKGSDLDLLLEQEALCLDGKVIDAQVQVGRGGEIAASRQLAVPTPKGYCFYLTNLPGAVEPCLIADLYRLRCGWRIAPGRPRKARSASVVKLATG